MIESSGHAIIVFDICSFNECVDRQRFNQYFHALSENCCVTSNVCIRNISREDITMCNLIGWSMIRMDCDGL